MRFFFLAKRSHSRVLADEEEHKFSTVYGVPQLSGYIYLYTYIFRIAAAYGSRSERAMSRGIFKMNIGYKWGAIYDMRSGEPHYASMWMHVDGLYAAVAKLCGVFGGSCGWAFNK